MGKKNRKKRKAAVTPQRRLSLKVPGILFALALVVVSAVGIGSFTMWQGNAVADKKQAEEIARLTRGPAVTSTPTYDASSPSKEYVYLGNKLVSYSEPVQPALDDIAVWRGSSGVWYVLNADGSYIAQQFGASTDIPAPGDYDGDGKVDYCIFRPSEGNWYMLKSGSGGALAVMSFGTSGDKPVPGDYDGDGTDDLALYRDSDKTWYVYSMGTNIISSKQFGIANDQTVPADYDGDGKTDFAMWRDSTSTWHVWESSSQTEVTNGWGITGDVPVQGDYDGDGKADFAILRNSNAWYVLKSSDSTWLTGALGATGDVAVARDYDGDAKVDMAVWRPSTSVWYINKTTTGTTAIVQWGISTDTPVPAAYNRIK